MSSTRRLWPLVLLLLGLSLACRLVSELGVGEPTVGEVTVEATVQRTGTPLAATGNAVEVEPATTATASAVPPQETVTAGSTETAADASDSDPVATWAAPAPLPSPFEGAPLTSDQQRTLAELESAAPQVRDDVALALAYSGLTQEMLSEPTPMPMRQVGDVAPFNVLNTDSNINVPIEAQLRATSEHAYFWFDTTLPQPDDAALQEAATAFDGIYELTVASFGPEESPGIDGDERLHILNASPGALCDDATRCGLLGYFSSSDALPRLVNKYSNERDMFVMNGEHFGSATYIHVLAHEFRHMIEDNYDKSDLDWEIEGSAVLATDLAGFVTDAVNRGNAFLENPDQQLNRWTDENTYAHYGQGYVLNRYIYDRLGPDLYRAFATHAADGLQAVTAVAEANNLQLDGRSLWLDWLVALAIHRHPQAADIYRLSDGRLQTAAMTAVTAPADVATTVQQYAADYYRLVGDDSLTLQFEGSRHVPLLDTPAASGEQYWYAQRSNYSHMQLERGVDLSAVSEATLNYEVYHDIEVGYDFAYVAVSEDGGATWRGLTAEGMQGLEESHDPGDAALTERFYTGESSGWIQEQIDLTPYAGREIKLRFSYVTDPILTYGGLALDNISIPEISLCDDAEGSVEGWEAQGFTRATAALPQGWHLQLITFPGGTPEVTRLMVDDAGTVTHTLDLAQSNGEAILIVAATAPLTLEEAEYRLEIGD